MTLRHMLTVIGAALNRGILGRSTHRYMQRYARSDAAPRVQRAGPRERAPALEYEPVFGWTRRQLDDYLARNPGYRLDYEAALQKARNGKEVTDGT